MTNVKGPAQDDKAGECRRKARSGNCGVNILGVLRGALAWRLPFGFAQGRRRSRWLRMTNVKALAQDDRLGMKFKPRLASAPTVRGRRHTVFSGRDKLPAPAR